MPYNKLPNAFLKLPDMGNIDEEPDDPYSHPTLGMIHSSKFKILCEIVLDKINNIPEDIISQFKGHRLEGFIENLELDELADVIRHTLAVNRDKIGWEVIDEINYHLDRDYTPRWELPDLYFDQGIRETLITQINWKPTALIRKNMSILFQKYEELTGRALLVERSLDPATTKVWSFKELYLILNEASFLVRDYSSKIDKDIFKPLISQLFDLFEENYRNKLYSTEQQIILIFLSVKATIDSEMIGISKMKILLDNSMNLIKNLDDEASKSYRLLYGFIYSIFWYSLFDDTSDLIMQRDLVAEIIEDIYKPEDMELTDWAEYIVSSKPHPLVTSLLLSGYIRLTDMLNKYARSLPPSNQRDQLVRIHKEISDFNHKLPIDYIQSYFNLSIDNYDFQDFYKRCNDNIPYSNFKRLIFKILLNTTKYKIIKEEDEQEQVKMTDEYIKLIEANLNTGLAKLHKLDVLTRSKQYRYDYYLAAILEEHKTRKSLILSSTFEQQVINAVGDIFSAIQDQDKITERINIHQYEIMILFVLNWMTLLYNDDEIRYEVIMILSPLVSIAYVQIAKGYLARNNLEAAFLSYFNSFYLMEMVNQDIKGGMQHDSSKSTDMKEKFQKLLKEWDIKDLTDPKHINKLFRSIESSIKDRSLDRQDKSFSMGGMLKDDIVMGFLDIITQLESFNQLIEQHPTIRTAVIESEIYEPPRSSPLFIFDYYGVTLNDMLQQQFPFPIIRNIPATSVAIQIYPIELKLPHETLKLDNPVPDISPPAVDKPPSADE